MIDWIKLILKFGNKINNLISYYDKKVDNYSSFNYASMDTCELFEKVQDVVNKKISITNLYVFYRFIKKTVGKENFLLIYKWANGYSYGDLSNCYSISKSTIYRKIKSIINKLIKNFEELGYNKVYFEKNYLDIPLIKQGYSSIVYNDNEKDKGVNDDLKITKLNLTAYNSINQGYAAIY